MKRPILAGIFFFSLAAAQPKVLLYYDMEGLSGVNHWKMTSFGYPEYERGRKFLTDDVNAAIAGLIEGGAKHIVVTDAHGSGNPEPDILLDQMDKRATFEFRDTSFAPYTDSPNASYQAIVCIGMHARANTNGFLAHTYTIEPAFNVNGMDFTETTIIAASAARFGVPVIMVSGDDVLEKQIKEQFPDALYAVVKNAKNRASCDTLPQAIVQKNIFTAAKASIQNLARFSPFVLKAPYTFKMSFQNRAQTNRVFLYPGLTRVDDLTVSFTSDDYIVGYKQCLKLISLATPERNSLLFQILNKHPQGKEILGEYQDVLHTRWLEPEKMPLQQQTQPRKRWHGVQ
ncbi:MAG: M55 family metallopeptidase [Ignavibacteriales bacterium]|nr:M55 family metallopeptidase [Ignavibacteriales bacterium]